eukprot:15366320-Ditylum_brightwellii.AAC.2
MAYHNIFTSCSLTKSCREWEKFSAAQQLWVNLKTHFNQAHQEIFQLQQVTQQAAGYTKSNILSAPHAHQGLEGPAVAEALANLV